MDGWMEAGSGLCSVMLNSLFTQHYNHHHHQQQQQQPLRSMTPQYATRNPLEVVVVISHILIVLIAARGSDGSIVFS